MSGHSGNHLLGFLDLLTKFCRQDLHPVTVTARSHEPFFTMIEGAGDSLACILRVFRLSVALIPPKGHRGHVTAGWEIPADDGIKGVTTIAGTAFFSLNLKGIDFGESQAPDRTINGVAGHVSERSGSERAIFAPVERVKIFPILGLLSRSQPRFPIETRRLGGFRRHSSGSPLLAHVTDDLLHRTN